MPLVAGSLVRLECEVDAAHPAGDHTIVVGAVRGLARTDGEPLVWFGSAYRRLSTTAEACYPIVLGRPRRRPRGRAPRRIS